MATQRYMSWLSMLVLLITGGCGDQLLLNPSTRHVDTLGAQRHTFEHAGKTIEIYSADSPGVLAGNTAQAYVLDFTGNSSRAESEATPMARHWGALPVEVWVMNYPGFGGSQGPALLRSIQDSALATYDQIARTAAGRPIFVTGASMGTVTALCVATHRPAAGMLLRSPPPLPRVIMQRYGWWNLWLLAGTTVLELPPELDSLSTAPRIKAPAIFVLSGNDSLIPLEYQELVVAAYGGDKRILMLPQAKHDTPIGTSDQPRLQADLDWLWAQTMPPTASR